MGIWAQRAGKAISLSPHLATMVGSLIKGTSPFVSVNVADRCPVGCACYWKGRERVKEMEDDALVAFLHQLKSDGVVHVTLVGGEPYVRPQLLEKLVGILPATWVVTSGTTPLRNLGKTTRHIISVDGPSSEVHDFVRGTPGLYNRIIKHLTAARSKWEFPVFIHTVLNGLNFHTAEQIIETWKSNGLSDGIVFSTFTPMRGAKNEGNLRLTDEQRIWIVKELLRLKKIYGSFIFMSRRSILQLHPDKTRNYSPETCSTARFSVSYDAAGERMLPCILGDKADCSKCGCSVTTGLEPIFNGVPDPETAVALLDALVI